MTKATNRTWFQSHSIISIVNRLVTLSLLHWDSLVLDSSSHTAAAAQLLLTINWQIRTNANSNNWRDIISRRPKMCVRESRARTWLRERTNIKPNQQSKATSLWLINIEIAGYFSSIFIHSNRSISFTQTLICVWLRFFYSFSRFSLSYSYYNVPSHVLTYNRSICVKQKPWCNLIKSEKLFFFFKVKGKLRCSPPTKAIVMLCVNNSFNLLIDIRRVGSFLWNYFFIRSSLSHCTHYSQSRLIRCDVLQILRNFTENRKNRKISASLASSAELNWMIFSNVSTVMHIHSISIFLHRFSSFPTSESFCTWNRWCVL